MVSKAEKLASEIAALEQDEKQALWEQVANLNQAAKVSKIGKESTPYVTYSQVHALVTRLPAQKLLVAHRLLVDLEAGDEAVPSFQEEFIQLPLTERQRLMAEQSEQMIAHYAKEDLERQVWQGGDFVDD